MREILFRGKTIFTQTENKWIYGSLAINTDGSCQIADQSEELKWWTYVDPKTVGQYTGLKDKNGTKIFEDDIVKNTIGKLEKIVFVRGSFQCALIEHPNRNLYLLDTYSDWIEVIGNIHDKRGDEDETLY